MLNFLHYLLQPLLANLDMSTTTITTAYAALLGLGHR
jgi:hypothetical protein